MMDCKKALVETSGDFEKSVELLRKKGMEVATKRAGKTASQGVVASYIHLGGKVGVLLEVNCESDFVAKGEAFQTFVKDVSMHIAAAKPQWISRDDVPAGILEKEKAILKDQALATGKPEKVIEKIVEGKVGKFFSENCLLEQPFVKDTDRSIQQYLDELVGKTGEKCVIRRFARYEMGEEL